VKQKFKWAESKGAFLIEKRACEYLGPTLSGAQNNNALELKVL